MVLQAAGHHFEIGDAPSEGVRNSFENKCGDWLTIFQIALKLVTVQRAHDRGAIDRRRKVIHDEVQDQIRADIVRRWERDGNSN